MSTCLKDANKICIPSDTAYSLELYRFASTPFIKLLVQKSRFVSISVLRRGNWICRDEECQRVNWSRSLHCFREGCFESQPGSWFCSVVGRGGRV